MDIKRLKQLSGLAPLVEAWDEGDFDRFMNGDDEDDLSPAERELAAQADRDLAAKGIDVGDVDPDEDLAALAGSRPADLDDEPAPVLSRAPRRAPAMPAEEPAMAADAAAPEFDVDPEMGAELGGDEAPPPEAQEVQQAPKEKKAAVARSFLTNNPAATRKEFMIYAAGLGMSGAYANTFYYAHKKKVGPTGEAPPMAEFWVVKNTKGKVLTESGTYDLPLWADYTDTRFDARIFENEIHAKKAVAALEKYGFKEIKIEKEVV